MSDKETYYVIEGVHKDPNDKKTIIEATKKVRGPFAKTDAEKLAQSLIQKNVDDFYHRAWVEQFDTLTDILCEECKKENESVRTNFIINGFKVCDSCKLSKTIFPL